MRFSIGSLLAVSALPAFTLAAPAEVPAHLRGKRSSYTDKGVKRTVFEHEATGAKLDFVTNSGICETTPGVNQYSGYISVGPNENMWFWFFEARNNPSTAPLATWLNGGPGCSSMIGLFQENGPCHFEYGASSPSLNPYSFNEYANMLYIDQPVGTGFSYGTDPVDSTVSAAPYVWMLLQSFFAQFPQYESRDFGLFTESYGGHYGPEFSSYIQSQNSAIDSGYVSGEKVNLVALGINNGWFDPIIQFKAYIDFSLSNTYFPLITESAYESYMNSYNTRCLPALQECYSTTGNDRACLNADRICYQTIEGPISYADFDVYDIREPYNDPYPPQTYSTYLQDPAVMQAIGARSMYQQCPDAPYEKFASTGDDSRSFLDTLSTVVQSGIQVLIWAGDADWICNWFGGLAVANNIQFYGSSTFANKAVESYTVNGEAGGEFKTVDNLTWLRVYGAGHEVPYYQPELALQVFKQTLSKQGISST